MNKSFHSAAASISGSIFNYFDGTFIINLPYRSDRRRETEHELFAHGISNWDDLRIEFFAATRPDTLDGFLKIGSRGSLISHLNALIEARSRGYRNVLLLEDDVAFEKVIRDPIFLKELSTLLNSNWDLLYFGNNIECDKVSGSNKIGLWVDDLMLSHSLAINSTLYDPLITHLQQVLERPFGHPLGGKVGFDPSMNLFRKQFSTLTYAVVPPVGYQRSSKTDLGFERWFDNVPFLKHIASAYRRCTVIIDRYKRLRGF